MSMSVQMWSSASCYCVIVWECTSVFEECTASVRVKIEGTYFTKILMSTYKILWWQQNTIIWKNSFVCVCVCGICSEEKDNTLSLHFICSCHLDLGDSQG